MLKLVPRIRGFNATTLTRRSYPHRTALARFDEVATPQPDCDALCWDDVTMPEPEREELCREKVASSCGSP